MATPPGGKVRHRENASGARPRRNVQFAALGVNGDVFGSTRRARSLAGQMTFYRSWPRRPVYSSRFSSAILRPMNVRHRIRRCTAATALLTSVLTGCAQPTQPDRATDFAAWRASLSDDRPVDRHDVSGMVRGCAGEFPVIVRLHDGKSFGDDKEIGRIAFEPLAVRGGGVLFSFQVPPGEYAISAFEDRNANGRLDRGWFGLAEPTGYHRPVLPGWRPFFHDVKFSVEAAVSGIDVRLR